MRSVEEEEAALVFLGDDDGIPRLEFRCFFLRSEPAAAAPKTVKMAFKMELLEELVVVSCFQSCARVLLLLSRAANSIAACSTAAGDLWFMVPLRMVEQ